MTNHCIKNTLIYKEFGIKASDMFLYSSKKFITHIDTLYYAVYLDCLDWKNDVRKKQLCDFLKSAKEMCRAEGKAQNIYEDIYEGLQVKDYNFGFYNLHIGKADCFDIFISDYLPNKDTCPIIVQLRSQFLWLKGAKVAFDEACACLEKILSVYDFQIVRTQENRIDFAFHTNYIQDVLNFFPEKKLKEMQVSDFVRWHKEGYFFDDNTYCDYFVLGRRKSNNVFFRIYDKTKEVIEMGYKQFFIPIWLENGLISKFDKYILEKCFEHGLYVYKEKARCEFYLEYGLDSEHKQVITDMLDDENVTYADWKRVADCLVPDLTTICNVEFQCKRKFFYNLVLPRATKDTSYKANVYNCFELYYSIINKLTYDTIRFVKWKGKWQGIKRIERPCADWWERLQNAKMFEFNDIHYDLVREYQNTMDVERNKLLAIGKIASLSAYLGENEQEDTFQNDISDFVMSLNDNDFKTYNKKKREKYKDLKTKGLI